MFLILTLLFNVIYKYVDVLNIKLKHLKLLIKTFLKLGIPTFISNSEQRNIPMHIKQD